MVDLEGNSYNKTKTKRKKKYCSIFWATWCGPCIKEMPDLLEAQKNINQRQLCFFYWFLMKSQEQILEFKKQANYNFTFSESNKKQNASLGVLCFANNVHL